MGTSAVAAATRSGANKGNKLLSSVLCGLFVALWMFNDVLVGGGEGSGGGLIVTALSALRWVLLAPAFVLALGGVSRIDRASAAQAIFLVGTLMTVLLSPDLYWSTISWVRIACPFALALGVSAQSNEQKYITYKYVLYTIIIFVFASFLSSFTGYGAFSLGEAEGDDARVRLTGFTNHPNMLGYAASIIICFGLMKLLFLKRSGREAFWWSLITLISAYTLYKADSRTAMLVVLVAFFVLMIKRYVIDSAKDKIQGFTISLIICVITFFILLAPLLTALDIIPISVEAGRYQMSTLSRLNLWNIGWEDFVRSPIVGVGLGTKIFSQVTATFAEVDLPFFHSVLINYMATCGLIGACSVMYMIFSSELKVLTYVNSPLVQGVERERNQEIVQFCVVSIVATLVMSVTDGSLQGMYPTFLLFFLSTALLPDKDQRKPTIRRLPQGLARVPPRPAPRRTGAVR